MAITIPIISEFSDKGITAAQAGFNNFKSKIAEADGAMGKMKAGFGAASDFVKANAASMASAAGAAIAGFVIKAIGDFQDLALSVAKFSEVTRIAAEDSSRWIEVAGDLGIETTAVQDSINKMNKALSTNRDEFEKLGIEMVKTADGTLDVNETFIQTLDALRKIKDPAERAKVATQLLGKSWSQVSELVEMGANDLRGALASVAEAKVIDEADIEKARAFRDAQDKLKESFEKVSLAIGQELVPMITNLLNAITPLADSAGWLSRAFKIGFGAMSGNIDMVKSGITGNNGLDEAVNDLTQSWWDSQQQMYRTRFEALKLAGQFDRVKEAYEELKGEIDDREAWRNLDDSIRNAGEAALVAFAEKTPEALSTAASALDDARLKVADYVMELDTIDEQKKTEIIANLDNANVQQVEMILNNLARVREIPFLPTTRPGMGGINELGPGGRELGSQPINLNPSRGAYQNVVVNVAGSVVAQNDLVESVRKGLVNAQRNGSGLVYSNS